MYADEEAKRLLELAERIADIAEIETPPTREGRTISMMLAPDKRKLQALADRKRNEENLKKKAEASETAEEEPKTAPEVEVETEASEQPAPE
jgi:hypothetical protein